MRRAGVPPLLSVLLLASILSVAGCAESGALAAGPKPPARTLEAPLGAYLALGKQLLDVNEPELAYKAFLTSMRLEGLSAEALTGAGIASEKQGLLTAARRHFESALEIDPESLTAHNNLGVVLFRLKEYYPARDAFRAAYALSSGRSGIAERNLNRAEAVVAQIEVAEQPDPAVSHRVVRLGTSEFRITPSVETQAELIEAE
jgi:Flp pilus assembly protein TadD